MIGKIIKSAYFRFAIIAILIFSSSIILPSYIARSRDSLFLDQIKDDSVDFHDREYPIATPIPSPQPSLESFSTMVDAYHYSGDWSIATDENDDLIAREKCQIVAEEIIGRLLNSDLLPHMSNMGYESIEYEYRLMRMASTNLDIGFWTITMFSDNWILEIAIEESYQRIVSLTIAKGTLNEELNFREYDYAQLLNILSDYMNTYNDFSFVEQNISVDEYPFVIYRIDMDTEAFFLTIRHTERDYFFDFESYYEYMSIE